MRAVRLHAPRRPCGVQGSRRCRLVVCSSTPKAVVFDLGKVLLDFDYTKCARRLSASCQAATPTRQEVLLELFGHAAEPTGLLERWGGRSLLEQLERGQIGNEDFYTAVVDASGLQVDAFTFYEFYADIFDPLHDMIAQHQLLRSQGVPTFILSNCSGIQVDDALQRYPFLQQFDGYCLSYKVKSFKPDAEIYQAAEDIFQMAGSDLVFIDDRADNAAAAADRGWHAVHHTSTRQTLQQLQDLGLPVVQLASA